MKTAILQIENSGPERRANVLLGPDHFGQGTSYMAAHKKPRTSPSHKVCNKCKIDKPADDFAPYVVYADGLRHQCRKCQSDYKRSRYVAKIRPQKYNPSHKTCRVCKIELPASEFFRSSANTDQLNSWCKKCSAIKKRAAYVPVHIEHEVFFPGIRRCTKCKEVKADGEFGPGQRYRDGVRTWCRACATAYVKARYKKDPTKALARHRRYTYGISEEQFAAMRAQQNNACAICRSPFTRTRDTHIDHSHATEKVRGLLCRSCNFGLGAFADDRSLLANAVAYLTEHAEEKD